MKSKFRIGELVLFAKRTFVPSNKVYAKYWITEEECKNGLTPSISNYYYSYEHNKEPTVLIIGIVPWKGHILYKFLWKKQILWTISRYLEKI